MLPPFTNVPMLDFSQSEHANAMEAALRAVRSELGRDWPLIVGGRSFETGEWITSVNPASPDMVVGRVAKARPEDAVRAIEEASRSGSDWRRMDAASRARILLKAATIIRRRAFEFSAWLTYEVSKTWPEAWAEVAEVIDFLEFYAREMMRLDGAHPTTPFPGEENCVYYIPLGVGAVISPWNFPLAIMGGMTVAAAVSGNTVIVKPASQAPVIAAKFMEVLASASMPAGVVNFLPGSGAQIGDILVDHPGIRFVAFTGSKDVGVRIFQRAAVVHPGQMWLKRTILEMGGKDAIVVDETADLDSAVEGIVASAFGYQGQKCSACSRLIVVDEVYDELLERVVGRAAQLRVGDPSDRATNLGAVIDRAAMEKIQSYIALAPSEGRIVLGGGPVPDTGYFVPPTIVADVASGARLAQEEIFGPVLAVVRARDFAHALEIANGTEYGLTGAVYSQDRQRLEIARREFHVGNLYFNRKCTGALVDVQPFGGFNMSGTDSKAGGRDYLQLFMQAKSVSERF
ncbi:MAG: L-glutamate gamma-semialdehyde dehydrogenase [Chthonomonadales bacterium]|nr:L-glutamate gamma-semialdehyde dehydrogenase [Chthonomonadales bacterium]